jgi:hypothetical protein
MLSQKCVFCQIDFVPDLEPDDPLDEAEFTCNICETTYNISADEYEGMLFSYITSIEFPVLHEMGSSQDIVLAAQHIVASYDYYDQSLRLISYADRRKCIWKEYFPFSNIENIKQHVSQRILKIALKLKAFL